MFVSSQAKRHAVTPVITFDQPLFWEALTINWSNPVDNDLKKIIIRLGAFHIQISFLGAKGHVISGSGLQELLEVAYAKKHCKSHDEWEGSLDSSP